MTNEIATAIRARFSISVSQGHGRRDERDDTAATSLEINRDLSNCRAFSGLQ